MNYYSISFNIIEARQVYTPINLILFLGVDIFEQPQGAPLAHISVQYKHPKSQGAKELHTDPASNGPAQAQKHVRILQRGAKQHQAK